MNRTAEEVFEAFKEKADQREVDTTNKLGYNGYKGTVYKLVNLEFFEVYNQLRFGSPTAALRYLNGTTRVTKDTFINKLTKVV